MESPTSLPPPSSIQQSTFSHYALSKPQSLPQCSCHKPSAKNPAENSQLLSVPQIFIIEGECQGARTDWVYDIAYPPNSEYIAFRGNKNAVDTNYYSLFYIILSLIPDSVDFIAIGPYYNIKIVSHRKQEYSKGDRYQRYQLY